MVDLMEVQCEEVYGDDLMSEVQEKLITVISPNLIMSVLLEGDNVVRVLGKKAKAEIIELNHVKVELGGKVGFYELGEHVIWKEVE